MRKLKNNILSFSSLVILLLLSVGNSFAQDNSLKLASDSWPPFTDRDANSAIAFEMVNVALSRMNYRADIVIDDFSNVKTGIESKVYDGSPALWKTEARSSVLLFSEPYLENQMVWVSKRGNDTDIKTLAALKGKRIGLVKGYAYNKDFQNANDLILVYSKNDKENVDKLINGEVDYILVDKLLVKYELKDRPKNAVRKISVSQKPFFTRSLSFAIRKDYPNAEEIISKFNQEISEMRYDGTFHNLLGVEWIETDLNNDGITEMVAKDNSIGNKKPIKPYSLHYDENMEDAPKQYFVDGKFYNSWDEIPKRYKTDEDQE